MSNQCGKSPERWVVVNSPLSLGITWVIPRFIPGEIKLLTVAENRLSLRWWWRSVREHHPVPIWRNTQGFPAFQERAFHHLQSARSVFWCARCASFRGHEVLLSEDGAAAEAEWRMDLLGCGAQPCSWAIRRCQLGWHLLLELGLMCTLAWVCK